MRLSVVMSCFAFLLLGACGTAPPAVYGSARGITPATNPDRTFGWGNQYFDPQHPCPLNALPDNQCNRQNPWPHGS